ncbi:MAG: hypothetical protein NWE90_07450, partial [Candidatus Bathyarchaeota archaeon]|nr:hypothetical protein [Candidatus Bathyarchaeota archaeon]
MRLNKKILFGPAILAAILIVAAISITPSALAVTQLTQEDFNTQLYPMHMGPQWGYMPHQYGPHGGYQDQGWEHYGWEGCPGMNYGYNT